MKNLTLKNIAGACGGQYVGTEAMKNFCITAVTTDSSSVEEGSLFVDIPG